ncbi:hypothetical protein LXL04_033964 [Taraxacum kok-saghyz]
MFPLPLLISPRLKTPISSERVGSDFEWVPSSPRSPFNCNLREPLPSASSAAASACPFYFGSGGCVDAVSAAIETLENDPCTNAGRGSNLTEDVHVECDASVMDGKSGTFGAVGATPISSERVGSDFEWVPSSPRSPFNCNLREPLPSASSAAASACPFYFVNNNRIGNISSSFGSGGCVDAVSAAIETLELCNGDKWTSQAGAKWTKIHPQQQQPNKRESDNNSSTAAAQGQNGQKQPPRMSSKNRKEPNNSSNTAGPPSTRDRGRKAKNYLQKLPPFL